VLPERKILPHGVPWWVGDGAQYFITICTVPKGADQLCDSRVFNAIQEAFAYYQESHKLWVHLLLLMPDHLHCIVSFAVEPGMQKSIKDFKKYMAREVGVKWQRDFFDHRLRSNEGYREKASYIRMNPVRAGLCDKPDDWPYVWENPLIR
jgi:putative transposase